MANRFAEAVKTILGKKKVAVGSELSRDRSRDLYAVLDDYIKNPDKLIGAKGIEIFDQMTETDADVKSAFFLKRACRLSTGWDIVPEVKDDVAAEEQAQFIRDVFKEMEGSVDAFLMKIWDGMRCGFKIAEEVYQYGDFGKLRGRIGLKCLKVRNSKYYAFDTDDAGNLKPDGLIEDPNEEAGPSVRLPVDKFVIFSWGGDDDDSKSRYGKSDYRPAYPYWFANKLWLKLWSLTLERYAMPTKTAKVPPEADEAKRSLYLDVLESLHTKSAVLVPPELEIGESEWKGGSEVRADYEKAMQFNSKQIKKALMLGSMLQDQPDTSGFGMGGLSQTQFDMFIFVLEYLGQVTNEQIMNEQVIRRLIDINFAVPRYPAFVMRSLRGDNKKASVDILKALIEANIVNPEESWVRDFVGIPQITDAEKKALEQKKLDQKKKEIEEFKQRTEIEAAKSTVAVVKKEEFAEADGKKKSRPLTEWEIRDNPIDQFAKLEGIFVGAAAETRNEVSTRLDKLKERIESLRILKDKRYDLAAEKLFFPPGPLKKIWYDLMFHSYAQGMSSAQAAVNSFKKQVSGEKFAEGSLDWLAAGNAISVDLSGWKSLHFTQERLDELANKFGAQAFSWAGSESAKIMSEIQNTVFDAIENNWTETQLDDAINAFALRYTGELATEASRLSEMYRTVMNDAYNQGRFDLFKGESAVVAMQYSAIMDDRTTLLCWDLDGVVWAKDSPLWEMYLPPNHFRCRSTIVPIFKGEEWIEDPAPGSDLVPAEGFGGPPGAKARPVPSLLHPGYAKEKNDAMLFLKARGEFEKQFAKTDIIEWKHLGGGCNATFKVVDANGDAWVWKPASGEEAGLRDCMKQGTYWKREVAASIVDGAGKFGLVPETMAREYFRESIDRSVLESTHVVQGSMQKFVSNATVAESSVIRPIHLSAVEREKLCLFDEVIFNTDRHGGNYMIRFPGWKDVSKFHEQMPATASLPPHTGLLDAQSVYWGDKARVVGIDNGLSFATGRSEYLSSEFFSDFRGKQISEANLQLLRNLKDAEEVITPKLRQYLSQEEVSDMWARVNNLLSTKTHFNRVTAPLFGGAR